jgi:hypothetical protein
VLRRASGNVRVATKFAGVFVTPSLDPSERGRVIGAVAFGFEMVTDCDKHVDRLRLDVDRSLCFGWKPVITHPHVHVAPAHHPADCCHGQCQRAKSTDDDDR